MKLPLKLVSTYDLKKKAGWHDLQICGSQYLILRNTNLPQKNCIHFVDLETGKFTHKIESLSSIVSSILFTCCNDSGSKIVGVLEDSTVFCFDFMERMFHISVKLPFNPARNTANEIVHMATDLGASRVLIITQSEQAFCFSIDSHNYSHSSNCSFASTNVSLNKQGRHLISICTRFYIHRSNAKCAIYCLYQIDDSVVVVQTRAKFDHQKIVFKKRHWVLTLNKKELSSGVMNFDATSVVSFNGCYLTFYLQSSTNCYEESLFFCAPDKEKFAVCKKVIFKSFANNPRSDQIAALQYTSDSSLLIVLSKQGYLCVFTILGEQLYVVCPEIVAEPSLNVPALDLPLNNADLISKQNFLVRSQIGLEDHFVISDGFQACLFKIEAFKEHFYLPSAIFSSFCAEFEEMLVMLENSLTSDNTSMKERATRCVSEHSLNVNEETSRFARSQTLGGKVGSFPDLVTAYERYLGGIGSNDSILSNKKGGSVTSLPRGKSLEHIPEEMTNSWIISLGYLCSCVSQIFTYFSMQPDGVIMIERNEITSAAEKSAALMCQLINSPHHSEMFTHLSDDKTELLSYLISKLISHFYFVFLYLPSEVRDETDQLYSDIVHIILRVYFKCVFQFTNKFYAQIYKNNIYQMAMRNVSSFNSTIHISSQLNSPDDSKNLYIACVNLRNTRGLSNVQKDQLNDYIFHIQRSLSEDGVDYKVLEGRAIPNAIAYNMLNEKQKYKTRCSKLAKVYQSYNSSGILNNYPSYPYKLSNSSLSMLYFFLTKYDLKSALLLVDSCISCYFAPENTLTPMRNHPELLKTDNLQKYPISFVNLVTNDTGQLKYLPFLFTISDEATSKNSKRTSDNLAVNRAMAMRSLARFMGRYFIANQKFYILPCHQATELENLLDDQSCSEDPQKGRKVFLLRSKIAQAVTKWNLTSTWTPQLAFSLMLVCGMFTEAAQFSSQLGNSRLSTAISCAAYKLNDSRVYQIADPTSSLQQMVTAVINLMENKEFLIGLEQARNRVNFTKYLGDLFQLGIVCGLDLMPSIVKDILSRITSTMASFALFIQPSFSLPSLPLFILDKAIFINESNSEESDLRSKVAHMIAIFQMSIQASNCDMLFVKHYLSKLQKQLQAKNNQTLPENLVSKIASALDVSLLDEPRYKELNSSFRSYLFLLWLCHVRDQFNISIRSYNNHYSQLIQECENENHTNGDGNGLLNTQWSTALYESWKKCISWASFLIPFIKFLGEEIQTIDSVISLMMQMPIDQSSLALMANVFYQPKRIEPKLSFDENDESYVFDPSMFALSHTDYDLSSNELVPFILEKKYKKLMLRLNNQPALECGEVFTYFVNQQKIKRRHLLKNGFKTADLFVDQSVEMPAIGQLDFELSAEYLLFIDSCLQVFLSHPTETTPRVAAEAESAAGKSVHWKTNIPVLVPYCKQVEKSLCKRDGTNTSVNKEDYIDDLMVPSMRHYLQLCVSTRAIGKLLHKKESKLEKSVEISLDRSKTTESKNESKSTVEKEEAVREEVFKNFNKISDHFSLISFKEQISHSIVLSGKLAYNPHIDKSLPCIDWLCEWAENRQCMLSCDWNESKSGAMKLTVYPNLLTNAAWNYTTYWNGWTNESGRAATEQLYVVLPVSAQYHIEELRVEGGGQENGYGLHDDDEVSLPSVTPPSSVSISSKTAPPSRPVTAKTKDRSFNETATLISDVEQQILQSINQNSLRENVEQQMIEARLAASGKTSNKNRENRDTQMGVVKYGNDSSGGNRGGTQQSYNNSVPAADSSRNITVDREMLREIIRSETQNALLQQNYASLDHSHGRHKKERSRNHTVEFDLSARSDPSQGSYYNHPQYFDEIDHGHGRHYHKRHSRSRHKHSRSKDDRDYKPKRPSTRYNEPVVNYTYYQDQINPNPQSVGIPLLRINGGHATHPRFNSSWGIGQVALETDPYYMSHSSYALNSQSPRQPHLFLNVNEDMLDPHPSSEKLKHILPSKEELEKFAQYRRMQLEQARSGGRQQRLAWVNSAATENKENKELSKQHASFQVVPTDDELKVKLLHAEATDEKIVEKSLEEKLLSSASTVIDSTELRETPPVDTKTPSPRTPRPILRDQQVGPDDEVRAKKSVTMATPVQVINAEYGYGGNDASFEVERSVNEQTELHDASTSPLQSPKKSRMEMQTQTSISESAASPTSKNRNRVAFTVDEIKSGVAFQSDPSQQAAAVPPEIFLNLHFPHVQKKEFISVVDIEEKTMQDLPEIKTLYNSDGINSTSYADMHWQIVKELRQGPKPTPAVAQNSPRVASNVKENTFVPVHTIETATSPFPTPRKKQQDVSEKSEDVVEVQEDQLTVNTFAAMDGPHIDNENKPIVSLISRDRDTDKTRLASTVITPRTRGKSVNDQLVTMADQLQLMEETSKRLMNEFSGTHYLMQTVEGMIDVVEPSSQQNESRTPIEVERLQLSPRRTPRKQDSARSKTSGSGSPEKGSDRKNVADNQNSNVHRPPIVSELDLREVFGANHPTSNAYEDMKEQAKKEEVRKWMKEKRKERISEYVEQRKDLAEKEHKPWRQKNMVSTSELKQSQKQRETDKADRDSEFYEKRLQDAQQLMGEIVTDQPPNTGRHPPPSVLSARRSNIGGGGSTNRSRTQSKLPIPNKHSSRSRSHSEDPPAGYGSWYEYFRVQANNKLAARRKIAEEIRLEQEQEEAELLSRLDELSQLSEHSHPNYVATNDHSTAQHDGKENQKQVTRPPPKLFTSLVKVQHPEKTRSRSHSPTKTHEDRLKEAQAAVGPLPKPSISPLRNNMGSTQTKAPGAVLASKKTESKPRVAKTYAERLKELQREKSPNVREASQSPVRQVRAPLKAKNPKRTPITYTEQLKRLSNRQQSPSQTKTLPSRTTSSAANQNRTYQKVSTHRDRPYASPYREATDKELIDGGLHTTMGSSVIQNSDTQLADDATSQISELSAWSVPTKVKQLLNLDGDSQQHNIQSNAGAGSQLTNESPRLTNIDFSEFDEMESQISSHLNWDEVQQIINDNNV